MVAMKTSTRCWLGMTISTLILCTGLIIAQAPPVRQTAPPPPSENSPSGADQTRPTPSDFQLSASVQLVNVTATVLDETGTYVDGLKQEDFQVFEDGVE